MNEQTTTPPVDEEREITSALHLVASNSDGTAYVMTLAADAGRTINDTLKTRRVTLRSGVDRIALYTPTIAEKPHLEPGDVCHFEDCAEDAIAYRQFPPAGEWTPVCPAHLVNTLPAATGGVPSAIERFATERTRQITEEGYTPENDAGEEAELLWAAKCYTDLAARLIDPANRWPLDVDENNVPSMWPWAARYWKPSPYPQVNIVKAAALLAAAADSLTLNGATR
ncbi:hypothetical protein [Glaciihabitans sp. dw_435]|uniref:hypothetical protein n=1 Tax=Glaciihabitans sp. dw_435 TaxID=2720081 RepID=UPI001BD4CB66|nr:hypothetical protein [Glaciihabitans sp. dw_435]